MLCQRAASAVGCKSFDASTHLQAAACFVRLLACCCCITPAGHYCNNLHLSRDAFTTCCMLCVERPHHIACHSLLIFTIRWAHAAT